MSCLHFKVDRRTRICPDCGIELAPSGAAPLPVEITPTLEAPPPQEIAARPVEYLPPPVVLSDSDDIYELLRQVKGKKNVQAPTPAPPAAPSAPAQPVPESLDLPMVAETLPVADYETLKAERDRAVEAATPDWIKEAILNPTEEQRADAIRGLFPDATPGIHDSALANPPASVAPTDWLAEETLSETEQIAQLERLSALDDRRLVNQLDGSTESMDYEPGTYPEEPVFMYNGGTAGTGKTYNAIKRVEAYDDAKLVATTGIAAVNLGGVTINSLLQYGDTNGLRACYETGKLGALLKRLTNSGYYRLIVDEVSMMDGHQLDILVTAIEELNVWLGDNGKRLFGMTLIGDFAQLPPIKAPFVFQRPTWGRFEPNITLLTEPRRQADGDFVRALQAVRRGDRPAAMAYFGPKLVQGSEDKFDGSTILATNAEVDRYNKLRMMDLHTPQEFFKADRVGEQLSEWTKNIPDNLEMKAGALVMILANKSMKDFGMIYANGDLGHYEKKLHENSATVTLIRTGQSVIVESVLKEKGVATGHTGKKLPREDVKGSIRYMPLRVAYATTCHKSQGLSLDRVQIMFHNKFWAEPGMLYVALSRARTPQGLRLVGTPQQFEARINVNPEIRRWL